MSVVELKARCRAFKAVLVLWFFLLTKIIYIEKILMKARLFSIWQLIIKNIAFSVFHNLIYTTTKKVIIYMKFVNHDSQSLNCEKTSQGCTVSTNVGYVLYL